MSMDKPTFPKWSVMIPAYGKGQYLEQTLRSVLVQAPCPEQMQIAVVENPSGNDGIRQVVERVAGSRVEYYINDINLGMAGNWNRCIEFARGELVHILHDDDWLQSGFYDAIDELATKNPTMALYATRTIINSEETGKKHSSKYIRHLKLDHKKTHPLLINCELYCPSVIIRNSFYRKDGGFIENMRFCPDWELWVRAITMQGGIMANMPLANYRQHPANETHQLQTTGENIKELITLLKMWQKNPPPGFRMRPTLNRIIRITEAQYIAAILHKKETANIHKIWNEITPPHQRVILKIRLIFAYTKRLLLRR